MGLSVGRLCHETGSEKANSPSGFESFIPSHPVTPVLLSDPIPPPTHPTSKHMAHQCSPLALECTAYRDTEEVKLL